ncbi:peptide chain release factor N(5)-glutamine methyltransferase [Gymnodinialimonas sp. 2305UL16-5]|uniref:peptide chain release factor N(5)-glutamine methyltransferase n=1 Tax=Gymnodinialimonas mytili TaxID=3126503 RepID=UPI0030B68BCA
MSITRPANVQAQLNWGRDELARAGIDGAARDVRWIMGHVLNIGADRVPLHGHDEMTQGQMARFLDAVVDRSQGKPVSQIIGKRMFYGRWFAVTGDVLDPRPETETLIEHALAAPFRNVLDLGTGSGCILGTLLAERPQARGIGTDMSPAAMNVAMVNLTQLRVDDRAGLVVCDWFKGIVGHYDLIVSNPPYISHEEYQRLMPDVRMWEPQMALTPGGDGLSAYRELAVNVRSHLTPGGRLLLEIGPTQSAQVCGMLDRMGLENIACHKDLNGKDRVILACRP